MGAVGLNPPHSIVLDNDVHRTSMQEEVKSVVVLCNKRDQGYLQVGFDNKILGYDIQDTV